MKRDMDLIREILLEVENMGVVVSEIPELKLEGHDGHVVYEHARLLKDAGFLDVDFTMGSPPGIGVMGLTWEGHDLLDSVRDDGVWAAVKRKIAEAGGSVPMDLLKPLAVQYLKEKLGLDA